MYQAIYGCKWNFSSISIKYQRERERDGGINDHGYRQKVMFSFLLVAAKAGLAVPVADRKEHQGSSSKGTKTSNRVSNKSGSRTNNCALFETVPAGQHLVAAKLPFHMRPKLAPSQSPRPKATRGVTWR